MKAFIVVRYGKKGQGRIGEMPEPQLRENDVLVQVHAAGVNPLDSKIRSGEFKLILPYRLPLILGNDVAGVVIQRRRGNNCDSTGEASGCDRSDDNEHGES